MDKTANKPFEAFALGREPDISRLHHEDGGTLAARQAAVKRRHAH